ncbi:MAG: ATP-dependent DNA helicase [Bacteroidota bacterium]
MAKTTTTKRIAQQRNFQQELAWLNETQRAAVDSILGPVMVIAGPGTGKTHILTARIGQILLETDTQPHNILCLTFTDAGVFAMRERLLEFIGPIAHQVHIYTFHSFCNNIIQENLSLFGRHDLEPLSDLERVEIIRRIIDELPVSHPLKRGKTDMYFYEEHLYDLFQRIKSENWTPAYISEMIDTYLEDIPNRKDFIYQINRGQIKKGMPKTAKLADAKERVELLRSATGLFSRYQEMLARYRRYDYDDMILWVLRAFEEHELLLRTYQERYLYFLVDEYQDTNGAQNKVIQRLVEYWDDPNLFIVGDDDQSIFEFQGARLKNIHDFLAQYRQQLQLVILKENYRSTQHVLNTARAIIEHNENRVINDLSHLGVDKQLRASNEEMTAIDILPRIIEYPFRNHEETAIALQLEELHAQGISLDEVAVIYARHRQVRNLITLLEKRNIPYNTRRRVNILDLPIIQNIRLLLEYLYIEYQRPHDGEHLLFQVLHFDFLGIDQEDIAAISVYLATHDYAERPKWRNLLMDAPKLIQLSLNAPLAFGRFSDLLRGLLSDFRNYTVPVLVERLFNRSGLLKHVLEQPNQPWLLQVVKTFFDFVKKENDRNPRLSVRRLLDILDSMDANRLPIAINKTVAAEDGVNLLTAHSSKGLEFRYVFLLDCVKDYWEPRSRGGLHQFKFPDTLTLSGEFDKMEARRRLFYVGMTRAKTHLQMSYSRRGDDGKELKRAIFIDEITTNTNISIEQESVASAELLEADMLQMLEVTPADIKMPNPEMMTRLLEGFVLSVSSMNQYLKCPLGFYYENVLRVPTLNSEFASFGTAMHNSLQRLFERMLSDAEKQFPDVSELVRIFDYEMLNQRGNFTPTAYRRRLEMGREYLTQHYEHYATQWHKQVQLEFTLRQVEVQGVPIVGTIDKLELHPQQRAHIVDYKTGSHAAQKTARPSSKNPLGGIYWRQLVFYKILYENHTAHTRTVTSGTVVYLEPDTRNEWSSRRIEYTADDVAQVTDMITETYRKIKAHDFFTGCGASHCQWCNFVRNNVPVHTFADADIESLDDTVDN